MRIGRSLWGGATSVCIPRVFLEIENLGRGIIAGRQIRQQLFVAPLCAGDRAGKASPRRTQPAAGVSATRTAGPATTRPRWLPQARRAPGHCVARRDMPSTSALICSHRGLRAAPPAKRICVGRLARESAAICSPSAAGHRLEDAAHGVAARSRHTVQPQKRPPQCSAARRSSVSPPAPGSTSAASAVSAFEIRPLRQQVAIPLQIVGRDLAEGHPPIQPGRQGRAPGTPPGPSSAANRLPIGLWPRPCRSSRKSSPASRCPRRSRRRTDRGSRRRNGRRAAGRNRAAAADRAVPGRSPPERSVGSWLVDSKRANIWGHHWQRGCRPGPVSPAAPASVTCRPVSSRRQVVADQAHFTGRLPNLRARAAAPKAAWPA